MKKIYIIALAALAASLFAVSCNKEQNAPDEPQVVETEQVTITATIPADLSKVAMDYSGDALELTWSVGDKIIVADHSNPSGNKQEFTLSSGEGTKSATFTGTAVSASSYDISLTSNWPANILAQSQPSDGSTAGLGYMVTLTNVNTYEDVSFSSSWATSKGGTFAQSGALHVQISLPSDVAETVNLVTMSADKNIFGTTGTMTVTIAAQEDNGDPDVLDVYATIPPTGVSIPSGTGLLFKFGSTNPSHSVYTRYYKTSSVLNLAAGQLSKIYLTGTDIDKFAGKDDDGTAEHPYLIADKYQMQAMSSLMASDETKYFKMVNDIDLDGIAWTSLNNAANYKKGINFDGDGHTISNLTCTSGDYPSFFGVLYGTAKNVTFEGAKITSTDSNAGVVGGYIGTVVESVSYDGICTGITISNASVSVSVSAEKKGRNAGAFAGQVGTATSSISDCHITGTTTVTNTAASGASSASNAGGFIGYTDKAATISGCTVSGTVSVTMNTTKTGCSAGGFIGNLGGAATISGCTVAANIDNPSSYYLGGFVGQIGAADVAATFTNCAFLGGTLTAGRNAATNNPVGGFIGRMATNAGASFTNCYVDGAVITATKSGRVGGFSGDGGTGATANTFTSCYVKNTTISGAQHVGGFAGTLYGVANKCHVESTTITANNNNVGGFAGYLENGSTTNCYTLATVIGGTYENIGGFVGQCKKGANVPGSVTYCFANGTVSGSAASVGAFIGGVTAVPNSVTKNIAWNGTLPFVGSAGSLDVSTAITDNYTGTTGTISGQATTLGWDDTIWNLSGSVPTLK